MKAMNGALRFKISEVGLKGPEFFKLKISETVTEEKEN